MGYTALVTRPAQTDLDEIFSWYEEQKDGLGFNFLIEFDKTLTNIILNPFYTSLIEDDARIASLKRFPHYIIYRVINKKKQLRILAIVHQHRDPYLIQSKVK